MVQMGALKEIHLLEGIFMPILLVIAIFGMIKPLIIMTVYIYGTKDPKRSIIKGNIINKREDYEDGVDNPDNMNHVVFR